MINTARGKQIRTWKEKVFIRDTWYPVNGGTYYRCSEHLSQAASISSFRMPWKQKHIQIVIRASD